MLNSIWRTENGMVLTHYGLNFCVTTKPLVTQMGRRLMAFPHLLFPAISQLRTLHTSSELMICSILQQHTAS